MDVESVRSGRSERSDRSRRSKRNNLPSVAQSSQQTPLLQSVPKNDYPGFSSTAFSSPQQQQFIINPTMQNGDSSSLMHSNMQDTSLSMAQQPPHHMPMFQPRPPPPPNLSQPLSPHPYTMGSWMPPGMPINPNYPAYPQPNMYVPNSQVWTSQQPIPQTYPPQMMSPPPAPGSYTGGGPSMTSPNPSNPGRLGPSQVPPYLQTGGAQHPLAPVPDSQISASPISGQPQGQQQSQQTAPQPSQQQSQQQPQQAQSEPYRSDRYDSHRMVHQDDTAWVEEATAVTGATSETGLSGGDNLSRFGARYGLAASLGMQLNGGANSGISGAAAALIRSESDDIQVYTCSHTLSLIASSVISLGTLGSPILMLLIPLLPIWVGWSTDVCAPTCEGNLIGISVKLVLLSIATWVLSSPCRPFCGSGGGGAAGSGLAILPRIRLYRTLFLCLVFVVLFAFWLFYTVRIIQPKETDYLAIVLFASSLTDTLLFLHYAGIALMELRRVRFQYAIHIVRSPDGVSKTLKCGDMSMQRAALEVLQFYMLEFTAYNPNQNQLGNGATSGGGSKRSRRANSTGGNGGGGSKYKFYDVDGGATGLGGKSAGSNVGYVDQAGGASGAAGAGGGGGGPGTGAPSASVRLYEEIELEKRVRKRRMRLLLAVEEAFTHVKRLASENCDARSSMLGCDQTLVPLNRSNGLVSKLHCSPGKSLDPYEAAQAVFPTLIRPLQKFMRATRQQARHPVDMVIDHLALCLAYGLSPHAFLERFNPSAATPQQDAAAAASAILTAKRARKQQKQQQQQQGGFKQNNLPDNSDQNPLLPKHVHPGGQQSWSIVADRALSRGLADGAIFQLRRGNDLSLLCTVRRLPLIRLVEEVLEPLEAGRFILRTDNAV